MAGRRRVQIGEVAACLSLEKPRGRPHGPPLIDRGSLVHAFLLAAAPPPLFSVVPMVLKPALSSSGAAMRPGLARPDGGRPAPGSSGRRSRSVYTLEHPDIGTVDAAAWRAGSCHQGEAAAGAAARFCRSAGGSRHPCCGPLAAAVTPGILYIHHSLEGPDSGGRAATVGSGKGKMVAVPAGAGAACRRPRPTTVRLFLMRPSYTIRISTATATRATQVGPNWWNGMLHLQGSSWPRWGTFGGRCVVLHT